MSLISKLSPKTSQTVYLSGTIVLAVAGLAQLYLGFDAGSVEQILGGFFTLFGIGPTETARNRVKGQRHDGTFTRTPELSPVEAVLTNLPVLVDRADQAVADLERVKQAASNTVGTVPVIGPLAKEALDQILNR